jgi:hypothetical protein
MQLHKDFGPIVVCLKLRENGFRSCERMSAIMEKELNRMRAKKKILLHGEICPSCPCSVKYQRPGNFKPCIIKSRKLLKVLTSAYPFNRTGWFNLIPTRLFHVIYCHGDKSYHCLVGIGLRIQSFYILIVLCSFQRVRTKVHRCIPDKYFNFIWLVLKRLHV